MRQIVTVNILKHLYRVQICRLWQEFEKLQELKPDLRVYTLYAESRFNKVLDISVVIDTQEGKSVMGLPEDF